MVVLPNHQKTHLLLTLPILKLVLRHVLPNLIHSNRQLKRLHSRHQIEIRLLVSCHNDTFCLGGGAHFEEEAESVLVLDSVIFVFFLHFC